ncbi:hypothetical protein PGT21_012372 [Puccinia graminis f. sp. tritici]|uniref:Uncharacterized protein n=1 Tax=Puccinia graminis f. sp. tritici TaxID=56615 RepID=A0A5B0PTN6_PUCGR|nr:hypothetical protein PGT21_012372 [Puccinia graminis f. sp. tritici]
MRYAGSDLISLPWSACVLHRNSTNSNFNIQLKLQFRAQPTRTSIPYSTNSNFNSVLNQLELQFRTQPTRTSIPYSTNSNFNSVLKILQASRFRTQDSSIFQDHLSQLSSPLDLRLISSGSWFVVRCDSWSSWNLQGAFKRLIVRRSCV